LPYSQFYQRTLCSNYTWLLQIAKGNPNLSHGFHEKGLVEETINRRARWRWAEKKHLALAIVLPRHNHSPTSGFLQKPCYEALKLA
jgi:hypothetical protein